MSVWLVVEEGGDAELPDADDVRELVAELDALCYEGLATQLSSRLRVPNAPVQIDSGNAGQLARALDHLRNTHRIDYEPGAVGQHRALHHARDAVLRRYPFPPLNYRIRSWEIEGAEARFWSFTGPYGQGDRLVRPIAEAWRVIEVVREPERGEDGILVVESWPTSPRL